MYVHFENKKRILFCILVAFAALAIALSIISIPGMQSSQKAYAAGEYRITQSAEGFAVNDGTPAATIQAAVNVIPANSGIYFENVALSSSQQLTLNQKYTLKGTLSTVTASLTGIIIANDVTLNGLVFENTDTSSSYRAFTVNQGATLRIIDSDISNSFSTLIYNQGNVSFGTAADSAGIIRTTNAGILLESAKGTVDFEKGEAALLSDDARIIMANTTATAKAGFIFAGASVKNDGKYYTGPGALSAKGFLNAAGKWQIKETAPFAANSYQNTYGKYAPVLEDVEVDATYALRYGYLVPAWTALNFGQYYDVSEEIASVTTNITRFNTTGNVNVTYTAAFTDSNIDTAVAVNKEKTFVVGKADLEVYSNPSLTVTVVKEYGTKITNAELTGATVYAFKDGIVETVAISGTWSIQNGLGSDTLLTGTNTYTATFTPANVSYNTITADIQIGGVAKNSTWIKAGDISSINITYGDKLVDKNVKNYIISNDIRNAKTGFTEWTDENTVPAVSDSGSTEYTVTCYPSDAVNYADIAIKLTVTVAKAKLTFTFDTSRTGAVYSQTTLNGVSYDTYTYTYGDSGVEEAWEVNDGISKGYTINGLVNGESLSAIASILPVRVLSGAERNATESKIVEFAATAQHDNYVLETKSIRITIAKATPDVSGTLAATAGTYYYSDNVPGIIVTSVTVTKTVYGETQTLSGNFAYKAGGNQKLKVGNNAFVVVWTPADTNFQPIELTLNVNGVAKKNINLSSVAFATQSLTYGANLNAAAKGLPIAVSGESLPEYAIVWVDSSFTSDQILNVGYYDFTLDINVTGDDAANYTFSGNTGKTVNLIIVKKDLKLKPITQTFVYGDDKAVVKAVDDSYKSALIDMDRNSAMYIQASELTITGFTGLVNNQDAGTYAYSYTVAGGAKYANYNISVAQGEIIIQKAVITVTTLLKMAETAPALAKPYIFKPIDTVFVGFAYAGFVKGEKQTDVVLTAPGLALNMTAGKKNETAPSGGFTNKNYVFYYEPFEYTILAESMKSADGEVIISGVYVSPDAVVAKTSYDKEENAELYSEQTDKFMVSAEVYKEDTNAFFKTVRRFFVNMKASYIVDLGYGDVTHSDKITGMTIRVKLPENVTGSIVVLNDSGDKIDAQILNGYAVFAANKLGRFTILNAKPVILFYLPMIAIALGIVIILALVIILTVNSKAKKRRLYTRNAVIAAVKNAVATMGMQTYYLSQYDPDATALQILRSVGNIPAEYKQLAVETVREEISAYNTAAAQAQQAQMQAIQAEQARAANEAKEANARALNSLSF